MTFRTYFWDNIKLETPKLRRARHSLLYSKDTPTVKQKAFFTLLNSDSIPAQCICFDRYNRGEANSRWGISNPFYDLSYTIRTKALKILKSMPVSAPEFPEASHASALLALMNLATPDDAEIICEVLVASGDLNVLTNGTLVVRNLWDTNNPPNEKQAGILHRLMFDDTITASVRADYVAQMNAAWGPLLEQLLLKALKLRELEISTAAAYSLCFTDIGLYFQDIRTATANWQGELFFHGNETLRWLKLVHSLSSEISQERTAAAIELASDIDVGAVSVIPVLQESLNQGNIEAAKALGSIGALAKTAVPDLINALKQDDKDLQCYAMRSLGYIGAEAEVVAPILIDALDSPHKKIICYAVEALGYFGIHAAPAVPILIRMLQEDYDSFYSDVMIVLQNIGPAAKAAVPVLLELKKNPAVFTKYPEDHEDELVLKWVTAALENICS